ncbi:MAG: Protein-L-isoaspartate O-methyltransferase [Bacteroidetes bacterium ADurb.Bin397]|jgi:protein-L-isoaspartate(D-aspartate) O-methyltransferase|nr:MAG: Protein-L-isoaspartate O-methyltransferase [Bacteroidetes bacterium ADurb.Bin397]
MAKLLTLIMIVDTFRHQGMRRRLVDELRKKGINNELVLQAIADVPRHLFMDNAFLEFAYADKAFPIEAGQTISQPYTVAYQSQLLLLEKGMKVLEIGTGSGYQTSVLYKMGAKVYSIERHKVLNNKAVALLQELNYNVKLFYGDGFKGLPSFAPFDRILITCGARIVPPELVKQLAVGGILVLPLGPENEQVMTTVIKKDADSYEMMSFDKFKFVPMLENKAP